MTENKRNKIAVIGNGALGKVLAEILRKQNTVTIWDKEESKCEVKKLEEAVKNADFVFLCIPTQANKETIAQIIPFIKEETIVLSLSKGLDANGKTMAEIFEDFSEKIRFWGIIGGPMIASEIGRGKSGLAVIASLKAKISQKVAVLFSGSLLKCEISDDFRGVAITGVLKNIYAAALGMAKGIELGINMKGYLFVLAAKEMIKIAHFFGDRIETIMGPAGLGDFLATSESFHSKNYTMGVQLSQKGKTKIKAESFFSAPLLVQRLGEKAASLPLLTATESVISGRESADKAFKKLLDMVL